MATANNAPLTNQGRADLRRSPTEAQIAFNDNRSSAISVVSAAALSRFADGEFTWRTPFSVTVTFGTPPSAVTVNRRLCLFLWMTDRITSVSAKQVYSGEGVQVCGCASFVLPTNGFAALPAGATCTPNGATDVGAQSTLAYVSGSLRFSVRGTPLLLEMADPNLEEAPVPFVTVDAWSESLLSGRPGVQLQEFRNGVYNAYTGDLTTRSQIILLIDDYLAGQYWNNDNVLVDSKGNQFDIVGVYAEPPYIAPPITPG